MTEIYFDLKQISGIEPDDALNPARARFSIYPYTLLNRGTYAVTKNALRVGIDGTGSVHLPPTNAAEGMVFDPFGIPGLSRRIVAIPDSATAINFLDLIQLDPDTLNPDDPNVIEAWAAALQAALDAAADAETAEVAAEASAAAAAASEAAVAGAEAATEADADRAEAAANDAADSAAAAAGSEAAVAAAAAAAAAAADAAALSEAASGNSAAAAALSEAASGNSAAAAANSAVEAQDIVDAYTNWAVYISEDAVSVTLAVSPSVIVSETADTMTLEFD